MNNAEMTATQQMYIDQFGFISCAQLILHWAGQPITFIYQAEQILVSYILASSRTARKGNSLRGFIYHDSIIGFPFAVIQSGATHPAIAS